MCSEELGGIHSGATWIDTTVLLKPGKYRLKEQRAVDTGFKESKSSMVKGQVFLILSVRFEVKWEGKRHKTDVFCKKMVNSKWLNGKIFVPLHPL